MILAVAVHPLRAASLRPLLPSPLRRTPSSAAMVVASAKRLRRWRRRPSPVEDDAGAPFEEETQKTGSAELDFLTARESKSTPLERDIEGPSARPPQPLPSSSSDAGRGAPLRGLDVLQALQRKAAAGRKGGTGAGAGGGKGGGGKKRGARGSSDGGQKHFDVRDYRKVRPLDIKSDWVARLDELDRLVQELQAQEHLYSD